MIYLLYDIVLAIAFVFIVPMYLYRALVKKKVRKGIRERFGFIASEKIEAVAGRRVIWVHAVSVGETMAAKPLLKGLREAYPDWKIVLSHVTETGRAVAEKLPEADVCVYFPFDFGFAVKRALKAFRPAVVIVVETEIWPNFFRVAHDQGSAVVIANGRISDRSFPRYQKFRSLLSPVLGHVDAFCAQSHVDGQRLVEMGAEPRRVHVAGNLKYDVPVSVPDLARTAELRRKFSIAADVAVLVAASTHAGEEQVVLDAARELLQTGEEFVLILVPRHPERAGEAAEEARQRGFEPTLRSGLGVRDRILGSGDLLLVDTIGELMQIYPFADIVFMGGSLVPVGGHNILEPASVGKPSVFGPYMHNFRDIAALALRNEAGWQITDGKGLFSRLKALLSDEQERVRAGAAACRMVGENSGATGRHLDAIDAALESSR